MTAQGLRELICLHFSLHSQDFDNAANGEIVLAEIIAVKLISRLRSSDRIESVFELCGSDFSVACAKALIELMQHPDETGVTYQDEHGANKIESVRALGEKVIAIINDYTPESHSEMRRFIGEITPARLMLC